MNSSRPSRIRLGLLAGVAAVTLTLAACGDDEPDTTSDGGGSAPAGDSADDGAADQPARDAIVSTSEIDDLGTVLVDAEGNTLYTTEPEENGTIVCVDECATFWLPLEADAAPASVEGVNGEFGLVDRPDGTQQLTLDGVPLYTFAEDTGPGSFIGDGFEDDFQGTHFVWNAVTTTGGGDAAPADDSDAPTYDY